ncbi:MAG: endonuclease/exonuclease/phosphatase family protein [Chloroflexota bacterium]
MDTETLRICSYNIRCNLQSNGVFVDGENQWAFRKDRVASVLNLYAPDLIGLQEVLVEQLHDLEKRLPDFGWTGVGRDDGVESGEFSPIFYRRSVLNLLNSGTFWLSETPNIAGSMGWDAACVRIATWACFQHQPSGKVFYHLNTHLDHRGAVARAEGVKLLQKQLVDIAEDTPAIISGDFNCVEKDNPYQLLTNTKQNNSTLWQDTKYVSIAAHHGPSGTFNTRFADPIQGKIDYIFLYQSSKIQPSIQVQQHAILADNWDGRYPSDHLPVFVRLLL